jgi:toxin-antitoxin system PIN domain toxin
VKLVDLNVLLYATDETSALHDRAKPWLDRVMSSTETIGIPTAVAIGFVRLTTSRRIMAAPLDVTTSVNVVRGWYRRSNVTAPEPTSRHWELLDELLGPIGTGGNLVADAHLAALSIEHGADLCSFDRDFGRFGGVRWIEPSNEAG